MCGRSSPLESRSETGRDPETSAGFDGVADFRYRRIYSIPSSESADGGGVRGRAPSDPVEHVRAGARGGDDRWLWRKTGLASAFSRSSESAHIDRNLRLD